MTEAVAPPRAALPLNSKMESPMRTFSLPLAVLLVVTAVAGADPTADRIAALYAKVKPTLVMVKMSLETETGQQAEASLPGLVATDDGLVIMPGSDTLATVPKSYFKKVEIIRPEKKDAPVAAKYLEYDRVAAVAFVKAEDPAGLTPLELTEADAPQVGQAVVVFSLMGKEYGYALQYHLARIGGVVSKPTDRYLITPRPDTSTGMVATMDGKLVGRLLMDTTVRNLTVRGRTVPIRQNVPLIQPVAELTEAVQRVQSGAIKQRAWIGVMGMQALDKDVAEALGLGEAVAIRIGSVVEDSPAAKAKLVAGDVVLGINGEDLQRGATDTDTLMNFGNRIRSLKPGEKITLKIHRAEAGKTETVALTIGKAPLSAAEAKRWTDKTLGVTFREMVFADRYRLKLDKDAGGAVVAAVSPSGPAATADLRNGDVVLEVDRQPVKDLASLKQLVGTVLKGKPDGVMLAVQRGVSERTVVMIELGD